MSSLPYLIVVIVAVFVIHVIMTQLFKDEEKTDKGFVLFYHKLTYRRRLVRSLWNIPIIILVYLFIFGLNSLTLNEKIIIGIIFILFGSIEIAYNYGKWKKVEN